jgi:hypothetical protein
VRVRSGQQQWQGTGQLLLLLYQWTAESAAEVLVVAAAVAADALVTGDPVVGMLWS